MLKSEIKYWVYIIINSFQLNFRLPTKLGKNKEKHLVEAHGAEDPIPVWNNVCSFLMHHMDSVLQVYFLVKKPDNSRGIYRSQDGKSSGPRNHRNNSI